MKHVVVNVTRKLWAFMDDNMEFSMVKDEKQQLSLNLKSQHADVSLIFTLVYTKCSLNERQVLWDSLVDMADRYQVP